MSAPSIKNPLRPAMSFPSPNIMAKPAIKKERPAHDATVKFLERIVTAFLALQNPVSRSPNPAFIKNTRTPASMTQTVSMATAIVSADSAAAAMDAVACTPRRTAKRVKFRLSTSKVLWIIGLPVSLTGR